MSLQAMILVLVAEQYLFFVLVQAARYLSLKREFPENIADVCRKRACRQWLSAQERLCGFNFVRYTFDFLAVVLFILTGALSDYLSTPSSLFQVFQRSLVIPCAILVSTQFTVIQRRITGKFDTCLFDPDDFVRRRLFFSAVFFGVFNITGIISFYSSGSTGTASGNPSVFRWVFPALFLLFFVVRYILAGIREYRSVFPLKNNDLTDKLNALVSSSGLRNVRLRRQIFDRNRSTACCTAFFQQKTVVLSETMLTTQRPELVCAVTLHELSHAAHPHRIRKAGLNLAIGTGLLYAILWFFARNRSFMPQQPVLIDPLSVLVVCLCIFPGISLCTILWNWFMQRDELAADAYAVKCGFGKELKEFLKYRHGSFVIPNPLPVYYLLVSDHPSISQRVANIDALMKQSDTLVGKEERRINHGQNCSF